MACVTLTLFILEFLKVTYSCAADAAFRAEQLKVAISGWLC
jgi:hypothetical protein